MKLSQFDMSIEEFMLYCSSKNLSKKTIMAYEQTLKLFSDYMKKSYEIEKVEGVTKAHIRHYVNFLQERGKYNRIKVDITKNNFLARADCGKPISVNTINNYVRNIKVFFNWLADEEEINKNPVDKIKLLKGSERMKPLLNEGEINSILNSFDKTKFDGYRNYIITLFIFDTGVRITECLNINVRDLDLSNKAVVLRYTKNKKERLVFFSNRMRKELQRWIQFKDRYFSNELLFPSNRGNIMLLGTYETALRKIGQKNSIELFPHRIRANFAQYYLLNGGDLYSLSRIMGHSSLEVTKVYLQLDNESVGRQYQKFSPLNGINID
ncbi:tyrosine-type recombinase/integrase [Desulfosporosinus nitroreducens]|uniref:tyrosine-type recombinase/integrase n=1 Tax=Desulfosporosinus nitroreducens TaxID=2018668 RepID=UPI00207C86F4|nr:tyrosine-type recombinase/integrase [Desulfosporosinus nitroreducens]MCO1600029.1 tyrosine-type recombinase/integrase [Desulfosporosinus nitroreducens]